MYLNYIDIGSFFPKATLFRFKDWVMSFFKINKLHTQQNNENDACTQQINVPSVAKS